MKTKPITAEQIRVLGLEALVRELGVVGMIRFLQQFEPGQGDYTEERKGILGRTSLAELAREFGHRKRKKAG